MQLSLAPLASAIMPDLSLLRPNQSSKMPGIETGKKKSILPATANTQAVDTKITGNVSMNNARAASQEVGDTTPPANPTATPEGGSYNTSKWVELKASDDSDQIYYTTDESNPDISITRQKYNDPIFVSADTIIKAIAYDAQKNKSGIEAFSYIIDTEKPKIQAVRYYDNTDNEISNNTPTNGKVAVRITTSEPTSVTPDPNNEWQQEDETTLKKVYTDNMTETIKVKDAAGNESEEEAVIDVRGIDPEAPHISFNPHNENKIYNQAVTYTVSDNKGIGAVTINDLAAPTTGTISTDGTYTITATDTAGNSSTVTIVVDIAVASLSVLPLPTVKPLSSSSITASIVATPQVASSTSPEAAPRADVVQASAIIDTSPGKDVALTPSEEGWKLWGIAWYWYGAGAGLLGSSWWLFGRKYFAASSDEF